MVSYQYFNDIWHEKYAYKYLRENNDTLDENQRQCFYLRSQQRTSVSYIPILFTPLLFDEFCLIIILQKS